MTTSLRSLFRRFSRSFRVGLPLALVALGLTGGIAGLAWHHRASRPPSPTAPAAVEKPSKAVREQFAEEKWAYEGIQRVKGYKVRTYTQDVGQMNVAATLVSDPTCHVTMLSYLIHWNPVTPSSEMQDVLERLLGLMQTVSGDASLAARRALVKMSSSVEFWEAGRGGRPVRIEEESADGWIIECTAVGAPQAVLGFGARRADMLDLGKAPIEAK